MQQRVNRTVNPSSHAIEDFVQPGLFPCWLGCLLFGKDVHALRCLIVFIYNWAPDLTLQLFNHEF